MSHHHHHHDHSGPIPIGATAARVVVGLLGGMLVLVLAGAIWLWPGHMHVDIPLPMQNGGGGAVVTETGHVTSQDIGPCGSPSAGKAFDDTTLAPKASYNCQRSIVALDSGPDQGRHTLLEIAPGPGQPDLHAGDTIRLVRQDDPSGQRLYAFDDYSRGAPLTWIVLAFVVVIVAVARWRGLRAVVGLVIAFGVVVVFMLPALLDGKPAMPVALVAGAMILYAVLYLAHGVNLRTSSALLGTLSAMVLAAVLSWLSLRMTHLTGLSEEANTNVATYLQHVSITGLLLAGFIIGSLGVLNDVTITQAAAAFELAGLDEHASRREIFAAAMRVGRDHIASTVYTLVLAYAGGALPLLLLFSVSQRSFSDVLTSDAVGIEIARAAVGGICLALSVPLTTVIAVILARPIGYQPGGADNDAGQEDSGHRRHSHSDDDDDASVGARGGAGPGSVAGRYESVPGFVPAAAGFGPAGPEFASAKPGFNSPNAGAPTGGRGFAATDRAHTSADAGFTTPEPGFGPAGQRFAQPGHGFVSNETGSTPDRPGSSAGRGSASAETGYGADGLGYANQGFPSADGGYPGNSGYGYGPAQPGYDPTPPASPGFNSPSGGFDGFSGAVEQPTPPQSPGPRTGRQPHLGYGTGSYPYVRLQRPGSRPAPEQPDYDQQTSRVERLPDPDLGWNTPPSNGPDTGGYRRHRHGRPEDDYDDR